MTKTRFVHSLPYPFITISVHAFQTHLNTVYEVEKLNVLMLCAVLICGNLFINSNDLSMLRKNEWLFVFVFIRMNSLQYNALHLLSCKMNAKNMRLVLHFMF